MSYIMVVNKSAWPLHAALSWAGIQQQCANNIATGGNSHDFVVGLGAGDLTVVPGSKGNQFDPKNNNAWKDIGKFLFDIASIINPLAAVSRLALYPDDTGLFTLGVEPNGAGSGVKNVKLAGKALRISPVQVTELYYPDGYTVTVTGGQVTGDWDEGSETFTVTDVKPLSLNWKNRQSHTSGNVRGRVG